MKYHRNGKIRARKDKAAKRGNTERRKERKYRGQKRETVKEGK